MNKVAFYTLGCKLNFSESSTLARQLRNDGFSIVPFENAPDLVVVNTCSVTDNADRKCRKIIRDAKRINSESKIVVIGCYAQLKPKEILEIPGVDLVLGANEKFQLVDIIKNIGDQSEPEIKACEIEEVQEYNASYSIADRTRSFLKVQDGCDYGCTFCTIPLARGKSRSDSIDNILTQAREIIKKGTKEIVLTGVNTGDYGIIDGERRHRLLDLLEALNELPGISRFRISSIEPNLLSEDIISLVANSNKFVPHFHIPLQSGSDDVLKKMRRRYLTDLYKRRIESIKSQMPNCCIGADVLVGFPGETDALFLQTYNFIQELQVDYLHVFSYSERENTKAISMAGTIPLQVRQQRSKMLRILSNKKKRAFYDSQLNKTHNVLFENDMDKDRIYGYTRNYIRVGVPLEKGLINKELEIKLTELDQSGNAVGEILQLQVI